MRADRSEIDFEKSLRSLSPRASRIDRDRLMYLAGHAAAGRSNQEVRSTLTAWIWPSLAIASLSSAAILGTVLITRPVAPSNQTRFTVNVVETGGSTATDVNRPLRTDAHGRPNDYLATRRLLLRSGGDVLPSRRWHQAGVQVETRNDTLRAYIKNHRALSTQKQPKLMDWLEEFVEA